MLDQQIEYEFDDIGNRDTTGGRFSSVSDYTPNRLNEHATRMVPPYIELMGIAKPTTNGYRGLTSDSRATFAAVRASRSAPVAAANRAWMAGSALVA